MSLNAGARIALRLADGRASARLVRDPPPAILRRVTLRIGDVLVHRLNSDLGPGRIEALDGRHVTLRFRRDGALLTFNATVVYETGFIRWAGAAGFTLLALLLVRGRS